MENLSIHKDMLSITRVSLILNCSPATIKRWYKWADKSGKTMFEAGLPAYTIGTKGTWYFNSEQVQQLQLFRKNLQWGQMSEFNSKYYWSKKKGENDDK